MSTSDLDSVEKPSCFVAYPSSPADRAESIEEAINVLQTDAIVDIIGWKSLAVTGRVVIGAICDEIRTRNLLVADITGLNPNVLFEVGYAIAHKKRMWLLLNPRIEKANADFQKFQLLTTVGYAPYHNSSEIVGRFYHEKPYEKLSQTLFDELLRAAGPPTQKDSLLYLRCDGNTEASMRIARRVSNSPMSSIIDDPQEVRVQSLAWYAQQVNSAFAIVCHFLSVQYDNSEFQNAKQALVAGIAHGLAKPLLILAHEPYSSPLDYRDLLRKHETAQAAVSLFDNWSLPLIEQYEKHKAAVASYKVEERAQIQLRDISIGESVAEYESELVPDYYVSTAVYVEALRSKYSLVVGRKGTGKTATLYTLNEELRGDPRNHVCVIKPVGYELEGIINLLKEEFPRAEQGYLVESFWKFLLYTELAKSVYDQLLGKPEHYVRTSAEVALSQFVEQNQSAIVPEFSSRLERAVAQISEIPAAAVGEGRRIRLSELLHSELLARLRILLGEVLKGKARVCILTDNLDKAWKTSSDLLQLSELLFGLLSVSRRVAEDFMHDASGRSSVNLSFVFFLRSDIYAAMLQFAPERDKLPARLMIWNDPELLKRIIEKRFIKSVPDISTPNEVWERYFVQSIQGVPTWEYIGARILPRPRDLIFLVKASLQYAVDRGRTRVDEKDLFDGEKQYSRFALNALIVEASAVVSSIEDILLHFVQSSEIVSATHVYERFASANASAEKQENMLNLLVELTFLGLEISPNRFEFLYDEQDEQKFLIMAHKTATETTGGVRRFRIHPAFHAFLEIKPHDITMPGQMKFSL